MCDLTTALAIGGAAFNYLTQSERAANQEAALRTQAAQQSEAANARAVEDRNNMVEQASQSAIETRKATAALRVAAGEAGVTGNTVDRTNREADQRLATDIATIESNRRSLAAQTGRDMQSIATGAGARISGIQRPSLIGTGLQIAGAYNDYETRQKAKSTKV